MWRAAGFRKTLKVLRSFPALILMPVVTFWVIGPTRKQCLVLERNGANGNLLVVSFLHTWINTCIMFASQLLIFFMCIFPALDQYPNGNSAWFPYDIMILSGAGFILFLFSLILIALIQFSNRFACCSTDAWYVPKIHKTGYDVDNPDVLINL